MVLILSVDQLVPQKIYDDTALSSDYGFYDCLSLCACRFDNGCLVSHPKPRTPQYLPLRGVLGSDPLSANYRIKVRPTIARARVRFYLAKGEGSRGLRFSLSVAILQVISSRLIFWHTRPFS